MTLVKSRSTSAFDSPAMESASLVRFCLALGAAFALTPGCHDPDAHDPDAHVHDAARDGDASEPDVHSHELDAPADAGASDGSTHTGHDAASADTPDAPRDRSRDLELRLGSWTAERGRRAEFRLVDRDGALSSLVVMRSIATGTERFLLADAMGAAPTRLDWFVDRDGDGRFGAGDTASHAPTPAAPPYVITLAAGAVPGDPAPLPTDRVDLVGHLSGFEVHVGVRFELTVTAVGSERTVAIYRDEAMSGADALDVRLPGVLRPGVAYRVFLFIDLNDNGVYDLRGDHGSGIEGTASAGGLRFGHDHHTNRTWWE